MPRLSKWMKSENEPSRSSIVRMPGHSHPISMFWADGGSATMISVPTPKRWYAIRPPRAGANCTESGCIAGQASTRKSLIWMSSTP